MSEPYLSERKHVENFYFIPAYLSELNPFGQLEPETKRMKSSFAQQDTTLIVDGEKLFINRAELIEKSPVFEKMFTADFKEKHAHEIELPGKNLQHFLKFLRCTLDGYQDDITDENVHIIIPLAHEYQVETLLNKADTLLADRYKKKTYGECKSGYVIESIIEADKYGLSKSLELLKDFASRKMYKYFSSAKGYDQLSDALLYEIAMKRWQNNTSPSDGQNYNYISYNNQVL
ncbi:unnamed protein product [Mytilus coruscus]|uniref:BTB domain-containing protein n=1 Tax=Mytilus coruscus TaxID=42192 RepID=A0A6J8BC98_MYTCO|nr:unnamed protein product [Mytilus coruscus]